MTAGVIIHDPVTVLYYHGCISFDALDVRAVAMLYELTLRLHDDL
jgi:hypothetical protein